MSWYRNGTIAVTANSATVTGTNTKWAQAANGVMPGMMLLGPDGNLYEINKVTNDTSLTLVTPYKGATASAQAYAIITTYEGDITQFSARFSAMLTAIGGNRTDLVNWLTSTSATVSIKKDDGTTVTVKSLKGFQDDQAKTVPISQGGTGATTAADAVTALGLGDVLRKGSYGVGGRANADFVSSNCQFIGAGTTGIEWAPGLGAGYQASYASNRIFQMFTTTGSAAYVRYVNTDDPKVSMADQPWARLQTAGTSDLRFKEVLGDLDINESLSNVNEMEFKEFYYLSDEEKIVRRGVMAQQIQEIDPEYVHTEGGAMSIDLNPLMMDALAAIQALSAKVDRMQRDNDALSAELADLQSQLK